MTVKGGQTPLVVAMFDFEKSTPGTLRYKERAASKEDRAVGYLYMQKPFLRGWVPEILEVTIVERRGERVASETPDDDHTNYARSDVTG